MTKQLTNSVGVLFRYAQQQFLNRLTGPDEEGPGDRDPDDPNGGSGSGGSGGDGSSGSGSNS